MNNSTETIARVRSQAYSNQFRLTQHAQQEMVAEAIALDDLLNAIGNAVLLENYPSHPRGACCLLSGTDAAGRPVHVVCTTHHPVLIIITVCLPLPPKWETPTQRRKK